MWVPEVETKGFAEALGFSSASFAKVPEQCYLIALKVRCKASIFLVLRAQVWPGFPVPTGFLPLESQLSR